MTLFGLTDSPQKAGRHLQLSAAWLEIAELAEVKQWQTKLMVFGGIGSKKRLNKYFAHRSLPGWKCPADVQPFRPASTPADNSEKKH